MNTNTQAGILDDGTAHELAAALSRSLDLPLSREIEPGWQFVLFYTALAENRGFRLELQLTGKQAPGPVHVDFSAGHHRHRRHFGGGRNQPLLRAIGVKPGINPDVIDATGGLGRDAFVMASAGCQVRILERSPVLTALLQNGLQTAHDDDTAAITGRMSVQLADSITFLEQLPRNAWPDTIYLDPMYPQRDKPAKVKKEMQVLQLLLGKDIDSEALLAIALQRSRKRVVVKRPASAGPLGGCKTGIHVKSKNTRYDIYMCQG